PAERVAYMLEDSAPVAVLVHGDVPTLATGDCPVIALDDSAPWTSYPADNPERGGLTVSHLAYVIYTSGSTGRPKGVAVSQRNLVHSTCARLTYYPEQVTGFLLAASFAFDSSVAAIFWTLVSGAKLVLAEPEFQGDSDSLARNIQQHGISHLLIVPSLFRLLSERLRQKESACLKTVILAGEKCPAEVADYYARSNGQTLYNEYGPTEAAVWSTVYRIQKTDRNKFFASIPIGRPITNTQLYILDAHLNPVPIGIAGELHIAGDGLVRGYLNRPDLTAEKFIPNPFSRAGALMYKSGDLARYLPDGSIEYLERVDHQVKVRGFRIELGEIEATLAAQPLVREAVVLARDDASGDPRLVAYYTGPADAQALRDRLREELPGYMVPAAFVELEALPLTPNGKLDRKALPAPEDDAYARAAWEAPLGPVEEVLAGIWQELLGVERVGRHDNFFALGGHSLLVVRLVERMRQADLRADVRVLFTQPTLAALADAIVEREEILL
ncbi:amino acid adenylation domain-containing protein, partial [Marinobacter halodurans]